MLSTYELSDGVAALIDLLDDILSKDELPHFSQGPQDQVLRRIFNAIKPANKIFAEFGSGGADTGEGNTAALRRLGWSGFLWNDEPSEYGAIYPLNIACMSSENVEQEFAKVGLPKYFGFLSIDIDSQDYWVWKAIKNYRPDVVCIESNPALNMYEPRCVRLNPRIGPIHEYHGASARTMINLGLSKGYTFVALTMCDCIFVDNRHKPEELFAHCNDLEHFDYNKFASKSIFNMDEYRPFNARERIKRMDWLTEDLP